MTDYVTSLLTKLSAVHETRRKMKVRGFYNDPSPGMYDLKGKFEDAAKSNATHERKMAFDMSAQPPVAQPPVSSPVPLQQKFDRYTKLLDSKGTFAGTGHRRITIPKSKITEDNLHQLGFEPVVAAIPEAGQDRFQSFRHPDNNYHLHSHGDRWTIHQDSHPAMTMLMRREGVAKAFVHGMPHVITEGVPGLAYYLAGKVSGRKSTADVVDKELAPDVKSEIDKVAALESLEIYGFHGVKRAAETSPDPVAALLDIFRKEDFGFDENGRIKSKTKFRSRNNSSEIEATTMVPLGGF